MKCTGKLLLVLCCISMVHCMKSREPENSAQREGYSISADEVFAIVNDSIRVNDYVVLDTRRRMDYVRGHLVSSYWMSIDSIDKKISLIKNEPRPIVIYDQDGGLENSGTWNVLLKHRARNIYLMEGGFAEWMRKGYPAAIQLVWNTDPNATFKRSTISPGEAYHKLVSPGSAYTFIDVRPSPRYHEAHIKGSVSIPFVPINEFVVKIEEKDYPRDKPVILYSDADSDLDDKAFEVMMRNYFTNVFILSGGLDEWAKEKLPVEYGY